MSINIYSYHYDDTSVPYIVPSLARIAIILLHGYRYTLNTFAYLATELAENILSLVSIYMKVCVYIYIYSYVRMSQLIIVYPNV